jgi:hypothetical protein
MYFARSENPDTGALCLTTMVTLSAMTGRVDGEFRTLGVCHSLRSHLDGNGYARQAAIMRCLGAFLACVHLDGAGSDYFLANIVSFLNNVMADTEFGDLLYLYLFISLCFVHHGWCSSEQLMLVDSLAAVESAMAGRLSVLGHRKGDEEIMGLWYQITFLWTCATEMNKNKQRRLTVNGHPNPIQRSQFNLQSPAFCAK